MDLLSAGVLLFLTVSRLSNGAPADHPRREHPLVPDEAVCGSGIPQSTVESPHSEPQNSPVPYTITISEDSVNSGGSVEVTVSSNTPAYPIRGLVLKAKCGENIVGSFSSDSLEMDLRNCDGIQNSGALYIDMETRDILEATLTWTAPFDFQCQDVRFHATIVKDIETYWVDQTSTQPLPVSENGQSAISKNELEDIWGYLEKI